MQKVMNRDSESLTPSDYDRGIRVAVKIDGKIYIGKPAQLHCELAAMVLKKCAWSVPWDLVVTGFIVNGQWAYQRPEDERDQR
jgi:hypothetical protein